MSNRDYYQILGINKNASEEDIKKAYRKLAREHHPDVAKESDKGAAETRFKEINEAYQVLSDPQKRKMYDQVGHAGFQNGASGMGGNPFSGAQSGSWGPFSYSYTNAGNMGNSGFGDIDPFDVFEEFFGFRGFGGRSRTPKKGKNLYYEMQLSFAESVFGLEREVNVESGKVKIKIPKGVRNGSEIRFSGKGMPGPAGTPAGDLYISVRISDPKEFKVYGDDLLVGVDVDFAQVALGDVVEVPVVDESKDSGIGKAKLKVPAGTQYGTRLVLRGKGMPRLRGSGNGDVVVEIRVVIPKRLSRKQKKLLEEYLKA